MLYRKSLSLAAALLLAPALPTTGATTIAQQFAPLPNPSFPHFPISPKLRTPHSAPPTLLAQAPDPRKAEADQLLQQGEQQRQANQLREEYQRVMGCDPCLTVEVEG